MNAWMGIGWSSALTALLVLGGCGEKDFCASVGLVESADGTTCECPDGAPLSEDGVSCLLPDGGTILIPEDRRGDAATPEVDAGPGGECEEGETRPCEGGTDEGECDRGTQTCSSGRWGACEGRVEPTAEVCNGRDDDCDGDIDGPAASAACADVPNVTDAVCSAGSCIATECVEGFRDCDDSFENGCEAELAIDPLNCGSCGNACGFGQVCEASCVDVPLVDWATAFPTATVPVQPSVVVQNRRVIVAGAHTDSIDFGEGPVTATDQTAFIATLDERGNLVRVNRYGATGSADSIRALAVEEVFGRLLVGGTITGDSSFGGDTLPVSGTRQMVLASYGTAGDHIWSRSYGGAGQERPIALAASSADLYVAGAYRGTTSFGGDEFTSVGAENGFIGAFALGNGDHGWSRNLATSAATDVTTSDDAAVFGGFTIGTLDLGDGSPHSADATDGFIARFDRSGVVDWVTYIGGGSRQYVTRVDEGPGGEIYVLGSYSSPPTIAGVDSSAWPATGLLVMRLAPEDGAVVWARAWERSFAADLTEAGSGLDATAAGELLVTVSATDGSLGLVERPLEVDASRVATFFLRLDEDGNLLEAAPIEATSIVSLQPVSSADIELLGGFWNGEATWLDPPPSGSGILVQRIR